MGLLDAPTDYARLRNIHRRGVDIAALFPVATEGQHNDGGPYTGANTFIQSKVRHVLQVPAQRIRLVYTNLAQRDDVRTTSIAIRAGVEISNVLGAGANLLHPVHFAGARDVTIAPGRYAVSDPLPMALPAGTVLWSRTLLTVTTGGDGWPTALRSTDAAWNEGTETGTGAPTDKTISGTISAVGNQSFYAPFLISGEPSAPKPFVVLDGDSILSGFGDSSNTWGRGFARRALDPAGIPYVHIAASGQTMGESTYYREWPLGGATDVIHETAINDLGTGTSLASMQNFWLQRWLRRAALGARVWQTTVTPRTTSTDSWATVGNQTPSLPSESTRTSLNDWLRDGAPINAAYAPQAVGASGGSVLRSGAAGHPLTGGYFDVADAVESARNSGRWKASHTSDGLHPNATGHIAAAAVVTPASFTRTSL